MFCFNMHRGLLREHVSLLYVYVRRVYRKCIRTAIIDSFYVLRVGGAKRKCLYEEGVIFYITVVSCLLFILNMVFIMAVCFFHAEILKLC